MQSIRNVFSYWWFQCVLLWLIAFVVLNAVGLVGSSPPQLSGGAVRSELVSLHTIPGIWVRWDANYYIGIANDGYASHPGAAGFFPLFPMLTGTLKRITGMNIVLAGTIISNLAFLFSILLFYKIARIIKNDHVYALRSVIALLVFPVSFFWFAYYAESLYLFFALLGVYLILQKQEYIGSGLALGLSTIARPVGWLVDIVMLIEFIKRRQFDLKRLLYLGLGLFLSVLGIFLYIYYLYDVFGTFMAIPNAQADWHRQWQFPWVTYWEGIRTLFNPALIQEDWFLYVINVADLLFTSFAVVVILISFNWAKKGEFPWSLSVYATLALLFFLSSQNELPVPLWGMTRWVGSLFPIYFVLGNIFKNRKIQIFYFTGSFLVLILFTVWWTSGRWIG